MTGICDEFWINLKTLTKWFQWLPDDGDIGTISRFDGNTREFTIIWDNDDEKIEHTI